MFEKRKSMLACVILLSTALLSGCAGTVKNMQPVPPERVITAPDEGKSLVVFMRPSGIGFAIQSSVFEIIDDTPSLIGIVAAKSKVASQVEPGNHLFMVVGENADYMSAEFEANKTYYALVSPRMGVWKARFALNPVDAQELDSSKFSGWMNSCKWVEKTAESDTWEKNSLAANTSLHEKYYQKWMAKDPADRPKLQLGDGK